MTNDRFPHRVIITRLEGGSAFAEPTSQVIYDGKCRNYRTTASNTNLKNDVLVGAYTLAIPSLSFEIKAGDNLLITDRVRTLEGVVKDSQQTNLGLNVWWDFIDN